MFGNYIKTVFGLRKHDLGENLVKFTLEHDLKAYDVVFLILVTTYYLITWWYLPIKNLEHFEKALVRGYGRSDKNRKIKLFQSNNYVDD